MGTPQHPLTHVHCQLYMVRARTCYKGRSRLNTVFKRTLFISTDSVLNSSLQDSLYLNSPGQVTEILLQRLLPGLTVLSILPFSPHHPVSVLAL